MKITNHRCGWMVTGKFIEIIESGVMPTDDQLLAFWHLKLGDARFADHAKKSLWPRAILLKHNGNFVITPLTPDISEVVE